MSVSLAMIPVALAMRVVMGKNNFENFVNSSQVRYASNFANAAELVRIVQQAGYDCEQWGGSYKTHIDGKNLYFWWEFLEGKWTAVFSKYDDMNLVQRFLSQLEQRAGRRLFGTQAMQMQTQTQQVQQQPVRHMQQQSQPMGMAAPRPPAAPPVPSAPMAPPIPPAPQAAPELTEEMFAPEVTNIFPTNFRDGNLLVRTLHMYGATPLVQENGEITCQVGNATMHFRPVPDAPYTVEVDNMPDPRQLFEQLLTLDEDYKRCVQELVYQNIKARIEEKQMTIQEEQVLEDNSIMLTLNING